MLREAIQILNNCGNDINQLNLTSVIKMSVRKSQVAAAGQANAAKNSTLQSQSGGSAQKSCVPNKSGPSSTVSGPMLPRKRAREAQETEEDVLKSKGSQRVMGGRREMPTTEADDSSESDESKRVDAFKDEEDTDNLRMKAKRGKGSIKSSELEKSRESRSKMQRRLSDNDDAEEEEHESASARKQQGKSQSSQQSKNEGMPQNLKLNEENLNELNRRCKLDFNQYIRQMINEEQADQGLPPISQPSQEGGMDIFKKKPFLHIDKLQTRGTQHIMRNKISDKFTRRDVQFYDLYVKKECGEDLIKLKDAQYPLDINADQYYRDIEVEDFNQLFWNHQLIEEKFGRSIRVLLEYLPSTSKLGRQIIEKAEMIRANNQGGHSPQKPERSAEETQMLNDPDLISLDAQLKQLEKEFGKRSEDIAEIFCKVSGRLDKMRDYLENKPGIVEWNYLEDLALTKPEDSPEFQVLLHTKGIEEIKTRREFLQATPVIEGIEEDDQQAN